MDSLDLELFITGRVRIINDRIPSGTGGFCDVYKGKHRIHGEVALKHINLRIPLREEETTRLIKAEIKAWKSLSHPHVLRFLGLYSKRGRQYLVSPWAEHGSLPVYLDKHPDADRTHFIHETADALSYLHDRSIIHGDIKGSNVLVSGTIHALLCDFGMSRSVDDKTLSQLKGSLSCRWVAPEILDEKPKSFATDILSGKVPLYHIRENVAAAVAVSRGTRPPRQPERSSRDVSYDPIWDIAERCWDARPEARPPAALVFKDLSLLSPLAVTRAQGYQEATPQPSEDVLEAFPDDRLIQGAIEFNDRRPVSSGGSCELYRGFHAQRYRDVALKRIRYHPTGLGGERRAILAEVEVWQSVSHPYVLQFYGLYISDGHLYLVSPWAEYGCLTGYLLANPHADRKRLLRESADALRYLHSRNIIHGDIKGPNILVSNSDHALICDFGMSRLSSVATLVNLKQGGTLRWMAPEVWNGSPKSFASDTFSFGMTIYEILSGHVPFHHVELDAAVCVVVTNGERPSKDPVQSRNDEDYNSLWDISKMCWLTKPTDRPTMEMVFLALEKISPPDASPQHALERSSTRTSTTEDKLMGVRDHIISTINTKIQSASRHLGFTPILLSSSDHPKSVDGSTSALRPKRSNTWERPAEKRPPERNLSLSLTPSDLTGLTEGVPTWRTVHSTRIASGVLGDLYDARDPVDGTILLALRRCRIPAKGLGASDKETLSAFLKDLDARFVLPFFGFRHDVGGSVYLAFPWASESSLWDYACNAEHQDLRSRDRVIKYLGEAADGLRYLHSKNVIHGNVKAQNIILYTGRAVLCDLVPSQVTSLLDIENVRGTHPAPELLTLVRSSPSSMSDVFAFGFTIYEVMTGSGVPPKYASETECLINTIPQTERQVGTASGYTWRIAEQCWRMKPEERPTMDEVHRAMEMTRDASARGESLILLSDGTFIALNSPYPVDIGRSSEIYTGSTATGLKVALKRGQVTPEGGSLTPEIENEANMWSKLTHDHILSFLGKGEDKDGLVYLVSPWMEYGNVFAHVQTEADCDRATYIEDVSSALAYMHSRSIIHGDVKALNILITPEHRAVLYDFGTARHEDNTTPDSWAEDAMPLTHMSPQIWRGARSSRKADVYAFGITISEILTGEVPFTGYDEVHLRQAVLQNKRPVRNTIEGYQRLWDVAELCWQADPNERPDMDEVHSRLLGQIVDYGQ